MSTFVACNIPAGFQHIDDAGQPIFQLNGYNIGMDPLNLPANGRMENTSSREYGYGITELTGDAEKAFQEWLASTPGPLKDGDGKDAKTPFTPIANGSIQWNSSRAELVKALAKGKGATMTGMTEKDLPPGVEGSDTKKG